MLQILEKDFRDFLLTIHQQIYTKPEASGKLTFTSFYFFVISSVLLCTCLWKQAQFQVPSIQAQTVVLQNKLEQRKVDIKPQKTFPNRQIY